MIKITAVALCTLALFQVGPRYVHAQVQDEDACEQIASLAKNIAQSRDNGLDEVQADQIVDRTLSNPAAVSEMHSIIENIYENPGISPAQFEAAALHACRASASATP